MELVETIENLHETETTKEEKRIFRTENLADNTYQGIKDKYYNQRFEDAYISSMNELGFQSYTSLIFKIVFTIEEVKKEFILFITDMQIANREEVEYKTVVCNEDEEFKNIINNLIQKHHTQTFLELEMIIKYFKFMSLDRFEDDEDDDEEEYDDYLPPLELPFFQDNCVVCMENKPSILILPCLHICHCITCEEEGLMNKCPMCREKIDRKIVITK